MTLPTAIKELKGTLRPCRVKKNEPRPQGELIATKPPKELSKRGKELWKYALEQMPPHVITAVDGALFARWCMLQDQFLDVAKAVQSGNLLDENGGMSGALRAELQINSSIITIEKELGFTPASRTKISANISSDGGSDNVFSEFD